MKLINAVTLAQTWLEACVHLCSCPGAMDTTVVLNVAEPTLVRPQDDSIAETLDAFLVEHGGFSNHTVAETIFPGYEYVHRGVDGVYNVYPNEIYPKIKDHPDMRNWGAYAYRLLRRQAQDRTTYNPLERCIEKMKDKKPKRAAYEVGLGFGFDLALYDDDTDRNARMGGPCLSHLSFKLIKDRIHLTALYRSHYYIQRAYGNLLGLARLQAFVAEQVSVASGPLVCHSSMAVLEHGAGASWTKSEVSTLISRCEELTAKAAATELVAS